VKQGHPIATPLDGAVEHLRGLFDAVGGGVERVGDRDLGNLGAIGAATRVAQGFEFASSALRAFASAVRRTRSARPSP
jgi:hypothetical protein